MSGTSVKVANRIAAEIEAGHARGVEIDLLHQGAADQLDDVAAHLQLDPFRVHHQAGVLRHHHPVTRTSPLARSTSTSATQAVNAAPYPG